MDRIIEHKIEKECLIRDFLRNRYKGRRIHFLREKGCIFVNGQSSTVAQRVKEGDVLRLVFKEELSFDYAPQDLGIREIYSDEDVLVVYKPKGIPSMPAAPHFDGNLFNGLKYLYPQGVFRVVTRLDKDTLGLVLVAKNALSHSILHEQMATVQKTYVALVEGTAETCCIDLPICTSEEARRYVGEGGKPSKTRVIDVKPLEENSIVTLKIETGRTHQIRVHMSHLGHPLVGDALYGSKTGGGQLLVCSRIDFMHPITGKKLSFSINGEAEIKKRLKKT